MKKQIFSLGIFKEALRQMAPYTILFTVFYGIFSAINMIDSISRPAPNIYERITFVAFLPEISTIILTIIAFNFVFKRKSGDFFGAVKDNKLTKYCSLFFAVMVQSFLPVFIVTVLSAIAYALFFFHEMLYISHIIIFLINVLAGCFLFGANTLLGLMLMGRWLSGIVFSVSLTYLSIWISSILYSSVTNVQNSSYMKYTADTGFFEILDVNKFANLEKVPVELLFGLVALIIGFLLFNKKGYEGAGGKIGRKTQIIFNISCALGIGLIAIVLEWDEIAVMIVFSISTFVAVIADMICSRTVKTIGRGFLSACIVFGLVFIVSCVNLLGPTLFTKEKMNVKSFRITADYSYIDPGPLDYIPDEFRYRFYVTCDNSNLNDIVIKDPDVINFLEEKINNQVGHEHGYTQDIDVEVTTFLGVKYNFNLILSDEDYEELYKRIFEIEGIKEKVYEIEKPSRKVMVGGKDLMKDISDEQKAEVYKTFYNEYNNLSIDQKAQLTKEGKNFNINDNYIELAVYRPWGDDVYLSKYKITKEMMPQTFNKIMEYQWLKVTMVKWY